ncbi:MAG: hypothetical protein IJ120_13825 [Solobacterium sp.]|nr:hypothetical protein [Solobacterium sp.]
MPENAEEKNKDDLRTLEDRILAYLGRESGEIVRCDVCRHHCPLRIPGCFRGEANAAQQGIEVDRAAVKLFFGREI